MLPDTVTVGFLTGADGFLTGADGFFAGAFVTGAILAPVTARVPVGLPLVGLTTVLVLGVVPVTVPRVFLAPPSGP